jgi:hypothetical protein
MLNTTPRISIEEKNGIKVLLRALLSIFFDILVDECCSKLTEIRI